MHPESFLKVLDEIDELTVLVQEGACFQGACIALVLLTSVMVGLRTSSIIMGGATLLCGLLVTTLVHAVSDALRDTPVKLAIAAAD